jgi:SAM-dependent methyltransferase
MVIGSLRSSIKGWKSAAKGLAVLILLHALAPAVGRPQEPAQAPIDEELSKQEKIYHSRGADVPSGYVTYRALSDYAKLLPADFCDALNMLGSSDRWLDIGAGAGHAILDYYTPIGAKASPKDCLRTDGKGRAVALSIEDRRTDRWRELAARLGDDRLRYLVGKRLRHYARDEIGTFQIITDVFGGFSYTEDLSLFVDKVLSLLEIGGRFYTVVQNVYLEGDKNHSSDGYQTELMDGTGGGVKICSWLKKTACVKVVCESKRDWESPSELISIQKVCSDTAVPRTKLLHFQSGNPPARRFQLER